MSGRFSPVAISGAGPVGLALALGLARAGVRSVVFEKKNPPRPAFPGDADSSTHAGDLSTMGTTSEHCGVDRHLCLRARVDHRKPSPPWGPPSRRVGPLTA
ncbi:MAG: FAD-dependent monooxygenase [Pseudonocardiaceae bacterium]|nr:FAD-dependent monooxygenase [Pseudonocardiaceae bacterium]